MQRRVFAADEHIMSIPTDDQTKCLLVEDDVFISDAYQMVLEHAGVRVCQVVASEPEALAALLDRRPDVALVDVDIKGGDSLGIVTALLAKDVAVAFVSGHPPTVLPHPFSTLPFLQKPVSRRALLDLVDRLAADHLR